jgi:hypothetical protein
LRWSHTLFAKVSLLEINWFNLKTQKSFIPINFL